MADELELIESLVDDFGKFKTKSKKDLDEVKALVDKALTGKDLEEKQAETKKLFDELNAKVDEINNDVAAKGATVKQMLEQLEEFKASKGRKFTGEPGQDVNATVNLLKEGFEANFEKIKEQANEPKAEHKFKIKTVGNMTASANLTGSVVATYASQPALRGRQKVHFRDLVNVIPSATGLWKFYRQNTPVGEGSFDFQTTHAAVKNQLDYDFTEVTVTVDYLAGFVRIAKQMLQDLPFMQTFVSNELVEDYLRTEDLKFFMQVAGAATSNTSNLTSTVTVEKIIQAIANMGDSDYDANGIVATNQVWAKILLTKPNDYSLPAGSAVTVAANGDVNILGIPVIKVKDTYIGAGKVLIGDWTKAAIIQTEGLNVNMYEQDSDNVQRNLITTKAEARVALAQLRLDAFSYFGAGNT